MATEKDVELIRKSEYLHTRFVIWLCLVAFSSLSQLIIRNSPLLSVLVMVVQLALSIITVFCFKVWREHRSERVERIYEETDKVRLD